MSAEHMRAIAVDPTANGRPDALKPTLVPRPQPKKNEILLEVVGAGVNRADVMQREGNYPPPPGVTDILGLEVSGRVVEVGAEVTKFAVGDEVCALLSGGGYAEYTVVPEEHILPIPQGISLLEAATLPEAACTVWSNLVMEARLEEGETALIHGGSSGIGTMAIQVAKGQGATVIVTAGSTEKLSACAELGADVLVNYKEEDFVEHVRSTTSGKGVDVILDVVGGSYLERNTEVLAPGGRLVVIGLLGGVNGKVNLGTLLRNRGRILVTSLRSRSDMGKSKIVSETWKHLWPRFDPTHGQSIIPMLHSQYPLEEASEAHREMEASGHIGKIALDVHQ